MRATGSPTTASASRASRSTSRRCSRARTASSRRTTTASCTSSRRTRSRSSTASDRSPARTATVGASTSRARSRRQLAATHVIVATGSKPRPLPGVAIDNVRVLDNEGALAIPAVPKRLGVVGAGVIGLEMGSVWRRLGADVTVLEALPAFLGVVDTAVAKEALKLFTKQGLAIHTGVQITKVNGRQEGRDGRLHRRRRQAGKRDVRPPDRVDRPRTVHRRRSARRRSGSRSTSAASSSSTATAGPTSRTCGRSATSCAARCSRTRPRKKAWRSPSASPASTATSTSTPCRGSSTRRPEIAWVGKTEQQLKAEGVDYRAGSFPVHRQRPRPRDGRHQRIRQDPGRPQDRPHPRDARHRADGFGIDCRRRGGHGVRRVERGPRADLPRAPVPVRGRRRKPRLRWTAGR